jgi:protein transport protein SEC23
VFNPHCDINFNQKNVRCCFCGSVSPLPANYAQHISPNKLPYEFMAQNSTFEFRSGGKVSNHKYCYLFVVDINVEDNELAAVREEMVGVIERLPDKYSIGLITYGRNVHIYEFSTRINTKYCINGTKEYNVVQIMDLIGITVKNDPQSQSSDINKRFMVPLSEYREAILSRIRNLRPERHIYLNERKHSCLGQAVNISISMA